MNHVMNIDETMFLRESNAIEGVYDEDSLQQAMLAWEYLRAQEVLTLKVIRETHAILMAHSDLEPECIGAFRTFDVFVGNRKMDIPRTIEPNLKMQFCFETMRANPAPDWKRLHVLYERIHPFADGNGRTGRMFMNWTRVKRCGLPILVVLAAERQEYYKWFR